MFEIKTTFSIIAIILTFVAYFPYIKDTINRKTVPHVYTWLIWGLVTLIAFGIQVKSGGGTGSWVTLTAGLLSLLVLYFGFKQGSKNITKIDSIFLVLSLIALLLWLMAKQKLLSIVLVELINILGFIPTIRKSWTNPYSETLFSYQLNTLRHLLGFFALQKYTLLTWLDPVVWGLTNGLFSVMLMIRRRQINQ